MGLPSVYLNVFFSVYFRPHAPTSAMSSSEKDVKKLVYFQILLIADKIVLFNVNYAVILLSKVCWFYSFISFL